MRVLQAGAVLASLALAACSASPRQGAGPSPSPPVSPGSTPSLAASVSPAASPTVGPGERHPDLAAADRALAEGRFEDAAREFGAVAQTATGAELRALALLGEGIARNEAADRRGAIDALERAIEAAPAASVVQRRAAYLLALRLGEEERHAEAASRLHPFASATVDDALQPYIVAEYARSTGRAGDPAAAVSAWSALLAMQSPPASLVELAYQEQAAMAKKAGDAAAALAWLTRLAAATASAAIRYEVATMAHDLGDEVTYAAQLRAIITSSPGSKEAVLAIASLRGAGYEVDRGQAGYVYYRRGAYAEARSELLKAIDEPGLAAGDLAFRLYYLGAAYEDAGQPAVAVAYYDAAAAAAPGSAYAHRAKYWAARSVESTGEHLAAAARFQALLTEGPRGEFDREAAFRAGYEHYRAGDFTAAIDAWEPLGDTGGARVLYWMGRALLVRGDQPAAEAVFRRASSLEPWGFYGTESARELGLVPAIDVAYREPVQARDPRWDALFDWLRTRGITGNGPAHAGDDAVELMAMGLRPQAASALLAASAGAGPWALLELAREAHSLGLADVSARLATRLAEATGTGAGDAPGDLVRLQYPVHYVELLNQESGGAGLDPLFVAAMIRQESFWDPNAGSRAGALGLTQVIPPTGEGIAAALGRTGFTAEDLFRPAVSIEFGVYYLAGQLRRFGNPYAALAAYNAGPGNAIRWADAAPGARAPDFVEAIDISETHDYVERVMDHYAHYLWAYR